MFSDNMEKTFKWFWVMWIGAVIAWGALIVFGIWVVIKVLQFFGVI